jgi:hypothetical protein
VISIVSKLGRLWVLPTTGHNLAERLITYALGRPVSNLMFSRDGDRTWRDHRVISDRANFNYTTIREIRPGRLLYMHDGQIPGALARINSLYIDVEKGEP